jgi:hypothetical protein
MHLQNTRSDQNAVSVSTLVDQEGDMMMQEHAVGHDDGLNDVGHHADVGKPCLLVS